MTRKLSTEKNKYHLSHFVFFNRQFTRQELLTHSTVQKFMKLA